MHPVLLPLSRGKHGAWLYTTICSIFLGAWVIGVWLYAISPVDSQLNAAPAVHWEQDNSPSGGHTTETNQIHITQIGFVPSVLTTTIGIPIVWMNETNSIHVLRSGTLQRVYLPLVKHNGDNVTATGSDQKSALNLSSDGSNGSFTAILSPGKSFTYTFTVTGTFPFYLESAPEFSGMIDVVLTSPTPTPTRTPTETPTSTLTATATPTEVGATLPPDPAEVAPALDETTGTSLLDATAFLYTGSDPIQTGVSPGTIALQRVAVLRGRVSTRDDTPLSSVLISVLDHPEFGQTFTRADGMFDLAVNGGGPLVVQYQYEGFLPAQRQVNAPWQDYTWLPDVVLIPLDSQVTTIDLMASVPMQVAQGSVISDTDGSRQATILFPQGVTATLVLADGTAAPLTTLHVRATEYTIGINGPNAMPGGLPPASGYTYAVELSVDEAMVTGAQEVRFSAPIPFYIENFVNIPVGSLVPAGFYDRNQGRWVAADNGRVIKVVGISEGLADLDLDGNGLADDAAAQADLGINDAERQRVAALYAPGQELSRILLPHLTPWDFNFPYGPPLGAQSPKDAGPQSDIPLTCPTKKGGWSTIGCEPQTLGEFIHITGTLLRLHYQSDRTPGRRDTNILNLRLSSATLPPDLQRIHLEIAVAGQIAKRDFAPQENLFDTYTWDGKDAYGRPVQGLQPVKVRIGYEYEAQYYTTPDSFAASFNRFGSPPIVVSRNGGGGSSILFSRAPMRSTAPTIILWQDYETSLGSLDSPGLGGWSLSIHHAYDVAGQTLYLGNGDTRRAAYAADMVITTVAGSGTPGDYGDEGPAMEASLFYPLDVAAGPDGSLYIADTTNRRIRRLWPDGIITTVAGAANAGFGGDGGPAIAAGIGYPRSIAVGPDGSLYITADTYPSVRRVGPDGIITTVAGTATTGYSGDGGPAVEASLNSPYGIAIGPDGSLYIAELGNSRIRRVGPDGIITTVAGNGTAGSSGDGGLATAASLWNPRGIAVGRDGSLFIADYGISRVRRVGPDGIITTVAGSGQSYQPIFSGDGGPATAAMIYQPTDVAIGADGSLIIADWGNRRIRSVAPDGIITTIAGNGIEGFSGDSGPSLAARLYQPSGIAVGPDGSLYIADQQNHRIRRVASPLPGAGLTDIPIPSADGSELYVFNRNGRHQKTLDTLTGALRYQFTYDTNGYLTAITDGDGNLTVIERTGKTPTAIVASGGQRTTLGINSSGWLSRATNPAGETNNMSYSTEGLLLQFIDPLANVHSFTYDALGRLIKDEDPVGGSIALARIEGSIGYTVTTTTALGHNNTYAVEELPTGAIRRTVTQPSGSKTVTLINIDGSRITTYADGTVVTTQFGPDPRWGMLAPIATSVTKTPSGLTRTVTTQRSVTLSDPTNLLSMIRMTDTITDNGAVSTLVYDAVARLFTLTTAAGRSGTWKVDAQGRFTQEQIAGIAPVNYAYDDRGLLNTVEAGSGATRRATSLVFNGTYHLIEINDALGRKIHFAYDAAGRPITQTLPAGGLIGYTYDVNGNLSGLTPPGRLQHRFGYTAIDQLAQYAPPNVNSGNNQTQYSYNTDRQLVLTARPDGRKTSVGYDNAGRLNAVSTDRGQFGYTYDPTTANLVVMSAPDGITLAYTYDGGLLTGKNWTGPVAGNVGYVYDNRFRVTSISVNGGNAVTFQYDSDSLLTQAGALVLSRSAQNGLLTSSTLGSVTDAWSYNGFAEPFNYSAAYNAVPLYNIHYDRDNLGRITQKSEMISGVTTVYSYTYDLAGRLSGVEKNGLAVEHYTYDTNGNRLSASTPGGLVTGVYDPQDRLLHYGATTYSYTTAGELSTKTTGAQTTSYSYDTLGNLLGVTLPDATTITYLVDGQNQRIGKQVNGVLVQGFLYENQLRPIAELDGNGVLVSRFVYATRPNIPDYLVKGGVTYRILTDQVGSVRLVVQNITGVVVQRMDYDSFGNVLLDTNPGFQPFGFAGGLYDPDTGLVRFGTRDYDGEIGRWTAKDSLGFAGGDTNLYAYVLSDPVNYIDDTGRLAVVAAGVVGAEVLLGAAALTGIGLITADCIFNGCSGVKDVGDKIFGHHKSDEGDSCPTPLIPPNDTQKSPPPDDEVTDDFLRNPTFPKPGRTPRIPYPDTPENGFDDPSLDAPFRL